MIEWIHPSLFFFIGAAVLPFLKGPGKLFVRLGMPALAFLSLLVVSEGHHGIITVAGQSLIFGRIDKLSLIFGYIFTLMAVIGMLYSLHVKEDREHIAAFIYIGSSLGAVFAGDLLTLFIFWEIMAFSSVFLIWFGGQKMSSEGAGLPNHKAPGAGLRYLLVHTLGGVCLLGGIIIHRVQTGSLAFEAIPSTGWGSGLILVGFLINAAAVPLHNWLPDSYPEATLTGSIFLATYTTKTALYALVRGYAGMELLIWVGVAMALYGVCYAIMENTLRRLLSYHIISQMGYMVVGVGIGSELAISGAVALAVTNILYKGLLFMGAGTLVFSTGKRRLSDYGGLALSMPITFFLYLIGGLSISGFPFFAGFISKSMVVSGAAEAHLPVVTLLLILVASGTFLSTTLKPCYFAFFGEDKKIKAKDSPRHMWLAMGITAFLCFISGSFPGLFYGLLPHPIDYHAYTGEHVAAALQVLLFTTLGFLLIIPRLHPEESTNLDTDWFYRKGARVFKKLERPLLGYEGFITEAYRFVIIAPAKKFSELLWRFDIWVIDGLVNAAAFLTLPWVALCRKFDTKVIDGVVNRIGRGVDSGGWAATLFEKYVIYGLLNLVGYTGHVAARIFRRLQTGRVNHYAMIIIIGMFILVNFYLVLKAQMPMMLVEK